ncbi:protein S100-A1-like [Lethenteron reissneri]|uniref:protein S100-A1-like n=1 Tax=Lethenteron reissneri TaxID=7753 RepID=UPI002AB79F01|nr:protein S100-A1-like [Lethenteron reissneri]
MPTSAAAMEDLNAVMDIFVREFCASCEGGSGSVSMRKHALQKLLVMHMRPYLAGACDPDEVRKIMGDLHENQGASVDFQAFMATWTRILVAGHAPFRERVFLTRGPYGPPIVADKLK